MESETVYVLEGKTVLIGIIIGLIIGAGFSYYFTRSSENPDLMAQIRKITEEKNILEHQIESKTLEIDQLQNQINNTEKLLVENLDQINQLQARIKELENESMPDQFSTMNETIKTLEEALDHYVRIGVSLPPDDGSPGSSIEYPMDVGKSVTCFFELIWGENTVVIKVLDVVRGSEAWSLLHNASTLNQPPTKRFEYILAKIKIDLIFSSDDDGYTISENHFSVYNSDGYEYEHVELTEPEPSIEKQLFPIDSHQGWIAFQIQENDDKPVLMFGKKTSHYKGIWLKLFSDS